MGRRYWHAKKDRSYFVGNTSWYIIGFIAIAFIAYTQRARLKGIILKIQGNEARITYG